MTEQLPLIDGLEPEPKAPTPRRLADMHHYYGKAPGCKCGTCQHLCAPGGTAGTYYKCSKARISSSAATDWRKSWDACGLWERDE